LRLLGVLCAVSLGVVACSGGDDDAASKGGGADRQKLINVLSSSGGSGEFSKDELKCMAPGMVDAIGVQALVKAGAVNKPNATLSELGLHLTDKQAGELFDAVDKCVDLRKTFAKGMSGSGITQSQAECVAGKIDDDTFRKLMVSALTKGENALSSDPSFNQAIGSAAAGCVTGG
jgi:hypothetical protein